MARSRCTDSPRSDQELSRVTQPMQPPEPSTPEEHREVGVRATSAASPGAPAGRRVTRYAPMPAHGVPIKRSERVTHRRTVGAARPDRLRTPRRAHGHNGVGAPKRCSFNGAARDPTAPRLKRGQSRRRLAARRGTDGSAGTDGLSPGAWSDSAGSTSGTSGVPMRY
jgi:hypothetical protein